MVGAASQGLDEHQLMVLLMILGHGFNKSELTGLASRAKSGQVRVQVIPDVVSQGM